MLKKRKFLNELFSCEAKNWLKAKSKWLMAIIILMVSFSFIAFKNQDATLQIARLKYGGGGDWYANKTSLPNLAKFCNQNLGTNFDIDEEMVEAGSAEIFKYPFVHMTGHGTFVFNDQEAENLRKYLMGGGFLHIDDNYGLDKFVRPQLKKIFPELTLIELPFDHPIYHQKYKFPKGLPKVHEHDNKPPQGFGLIYKNRLVCFYTFECDLGNGWEDQIIYNDPPAIRQKALEMGANMIQYVFTK